MPQVKGADLHCYYQRSIDWTEVGKSDLQFFYVQISRGGEILLVTRDGMTYSPGSQIEGVRKIRRLLGGYHFCTDDYSPELQAAVFAGELRRWGALDLPPVMDLENPFTADDPWTVEFGARFLRAMRQQGFGQVGIYGNAYFLSKIRPLAWDVPDLVVWVADYGPKNDPASTPELRYYSDAYDIRQYTSKAIVPGIGPSYVDLNRSDLTFLRFAS